MPHTLTAADLDQFTGTETWYRHGMIRTVLYTDGVQYMADTGGAYWLIDIIAIAQACTKRVKAEPFQVWTLTRNTTGSGAVVRCEDGDGHKVYVQRIPFTDFPLDTITLWVENNVIYLPSER